MQINYHYEPEILLKDLFFDILYHWRSILVAALAGAVLLTGYQHFFPKAKPTEDVDTNYELAMEQYEADVKNYESKMAYNAKMIEDVQDYMSKSVYMNLDPGTVCSEERTYLVKLKQDWGGIQGMSPSDPVNDLMALYTYTLTDKLDSEQMISMLGTDDKFFIEELVSLKVNNDSNTMRLVVYGASDDMVSKVCDFFSNRLMTECSARMQGIYPHDLLPISDYKNQRSLQSQLMEAQQKQIQAMDKYQSSITDAEKALKKLTKPSKPEAKKKQPGMMAAIGFVLFALLTAVFYGVMYLAKERLRDSAEMTQRYGLFVFADATHSRARHPGKGIDGLIESLEFGKNWKDAAEAGRQAATLLCKTLTRDSNLVLLSTRPEEKLRTLREALVEGLNAQNVQISTVASCIREDNISNIPVDSVLLIVEEKHQSTIVEINREAELVSLLGLKMEGAVLL